MEPPPPDPEDESIKESRIDSDRDSVGKGIGGSWRGFVDDEGDEREMSRTSLDECWPAGRVPSECRSTDLPSSVDNDILGISS
jgi:hypothetical protein